MTHKKWRKEMKKVRRLALLAMFVLLAYGCGEQSTGHDSSGAKKTEEQAGKNYTSLDNIDDRNNANPPKVGEILFYDGTDPDKMFFYANTGNSFFFISRLNPVGKATADQAFIQFSVIPSSKSVKKYYSRISEFYRGNVHQGALLPKTRYTVQKVVKMGNGHIVTLKEDE